MTAAILTIITKSHLPYARVLMASIRRWAPEARRFAILADRIDGGLDAAAEDFEIISSDTLSIPESRWFHFKYSAMELNMALKPHAIQYLFERFGFEAVLYFDADIKVYGDLDPLLKKLDEHSFILTPHLTRPLSDRGRPSDLDILRAGIYNGGFLLLRNCEESNRFIAWWKARLQDHCLVDYPNGLFVDQRWLDFVPAFFPEAGILREPGYNVAYWNLGHRRIERSGNRWLADGQPLYFAHFSGFDPEKPQGISKHQNRHSLQSVGTDAREFFLDYANEVLSRGYQECRKLPYAYGFFDNGIAISDAARRAFYESAEISKSIEDPFSDLGYQSLVRFWNAPASGGRRRITDLGYAGRENQSGDVEASPEPQRPLPKLARSIYESRPDVQKAFSRPQAEDRLQFLRWLLSAGVIEHKIGEEFLAPLREEWEYALSRLSPIGRAKQRSLRWAMAAWRRAQSAR